MATPDPIAWPGSGPRTVDHFRVYAQTTTVGGRRLRYLDVGDGPVIVLIHGLGGSWHSWYENLAALAERHRVVAVDLPGFGGSATLKGTASIPRHADAVAGLLAALGIRRASVIAHSMGGLVAMRLAAERPTLVARMVLVNGGGVALDRLRLAVIGHGFRAAKTLIGQPLVLGRVARIGHLRRAAMWFFLDDPRTLSASLASEIMPRMAAPGLVGAVRAASAEVGRTPPSAIHCPVLVVWGANDRLVPLALAERLARDLPDGRLVVLPAAGHCPMIERPAEFNDAVLRFLPRPRRARTR
jgi:pimeloyl-ACP methyl ester carboxylesterase